MKNDNAGELSYLLNQGDDFGETHNVLLSFDLIDSASKYNFHFSVGSVEYSGAIESTKEKRDIYFNELNQFNLKFDNNSYRNNTSFSSLGLSYYFIQSNLITIGATGQKSTLHKIISKKLYPSRYWIYYQNGEPNRHIFLINYSFGYNLLLLENDKIRLNSMSSLQINLANKYNFSGIGANTFVNLKFRNKKVRKYSFDLDFQGFYLSNLFHYQNAFVELDVRLNWKRFSIYTGINKPIVKYLDNPYLKYNDMEMLFIYGLAYSFH